MLSKQRMHQPHSGNSAYCQTNFERSSRNKAFVGDSLACFAKFIVKIMYTSHVQAVIESKKQKKNILAPPTRETFLWCI